jgi:divalent metal cation (Fe/Co/Zn/Cd) transporter
MGAGAEINRRRRRDREVARVLWVVFGLNLAVAAVKLTVGAATGALSLLADGVHALLDASSNVAWSARGGVPPG